MPRNYHAINAQFRTSAGPMKTKNKETGREFKKDWKQHAVDAESDFVHPAEILSEEHEKEIFEMMGNCTLCKGNDHTADNCQAYMTGVHAVHVPTKIDPTVALKYDQGSEKLPWDLLPIEAVEGMLKVLLYGQRKYTVCGECGSKWYANPRIDGDPPTDRCRDCGKTGCAVTGAHNWRKGFKWTRLIAAAFRHLKSVLMCEDIDSESGLPHVDHLMCMVAFISAHQKNNYGVDDRWRPQCLNPEKNTQV